MLATESQWRAKARQAIRTCPVFAIRQTQVEESKDGLVLSGRVDTWYQKQMAQEIVAAVCKEVQVFNELRVESS